MWTAKYGPPTTFCLLCSSCSSDCSWLFPTTRGASFFQTMAEKASECGNPFLCSSFFLELCLRPNAGLFWLFVKYNTEYLFMYVHVNLWIQKTTATATLPSYASNDASWPFHVSWQNGAIVLTCVMQWKLNPQPPAINIYQPSTIQRGRFPCGYVGSIKISRVNPVLPAKLPSFLLLQPGSNKNHQFSTPKEHQL